MRLQPVTLGAGLSEQHPSGRFGDKRRLLHSQTPSPECAESRRINEIANRELTTNRRSRLFDTSAGNIELLTVPASVGRLAIRAAEFGPEADFVLRALGGKPMPKKFSLTRKKRGPLRGQ